MSCLGQGGAPPVPASSFMGRQERLQGHWLQLTMYVLCPHVEGLEACT